MMPQQVAYVGVDVSKRTLDVGGPEGVWQVANDAAGVARLLQRLEGLGARVVVGVEPSGGYERELVRALVAAGVEVRWCDPARVRALAKALGAPAKTDAIDARMIARFVEQAEGRGIVLDEERRWLKDLLAARAAAGQAARQLRAQAQALEHAPAREALEALAAAAEDQARQLTEALMMRLHHSPALRDLWIRLQTAPGIGPLVAAELVAHMPELGRVSGKAIAKLAGLAPFIRKSGAWAGRAVCSGGRARPRQALYLAVIASLRARHGLRSDYQRFISAGKPPKLAIIACMRRLLVALNAIARDNINWRTA